ncbi:MAG TPA: two pore domain potassium channel family protein, partial [Nitrosomonas sp.]|nr:two pore domain potassium channel family protein [Nitrosomonas sp.]HNJ93063.1 two pore domain potassium channel family protein [Nitrosomonas sp.]
MHYFVILIIASCIVSICVILHYEALRFLGSTLGAHVHKRIGVLLVMFGLLIAHILEIWIFAIGYILVQHGIELGHIQGIEQGNLIDFVYYSSV